MRNLIRSAIALAALVISSAPVQALEEVVVELPLMENTLTVKLSELKDPAALMQGTSDLAYWIAPAMASWAANCSSSSTTPCR